MRQRLQLDKYLAPELEAQAAERDQLSAGAPAAQVGTLRHCKSAASLCWRAAPTGA